MSADKPKKLSAVDPVEAQLRFEAALYGDWYSRSVLTSYLQGKSSGEADLKTKGFVKPNCSEPKN
jgi:hypothetical protein